MYWVYNMRDASWVFPSDDPGRHTLQSAIHVLDGGWPELRAHSHSATKWQSKNSNLGFTDSGAQFFTTVSPALWPGESLPNPLLLRKVWEETCSFVGKMKVVVVERS